MAESSSPSCAPADGFERGKCRRSRILLFGFVLPVFASAAILLALNLWFYNLSPSKYDLSLLGQNELLSDTFGSARIRLLDHKTGQSVSGAKVQVAIRNRQTKNVQELASFTTDERGTGNPRFKVPDWPDGTCDLIVTASPDGKTEELTQEVTLMRSWKVMLSCDKPVYKPGDTIQVRSLALRQPDLKPVGKHGVVFTIADPKGNMIFKDEKQTSAYGIAAAECALATELIEGQYTIASKVGNSESKLIVEVKKYVLPRFKIEVALDKSWYQPGDKVAGTVEAAYFFGKPVAHGQVKVVARGQDSGDMIQEIAVETDAVGKAKFALQLPRTMPGWVQDPSHAQLFVDVGVTDSAEQTQSRTVPCVVAVEPLQIQFLPESGTLVPNVANIIYLYASYPDGRPASGARISLTGVVNAELDRPEVVTNQQGVATLQLTPRAANLSLWIFAKGSKGETSQRQVSLAIGQTTQDFILRPDRAVYDGGQKQGMTLAALGGGSEPVFVDLIKNDQTMLTDVISMTDGRGTVTIDLPPELFGTLQLCAYRHDRLGLRVRKSRIIFVKPASHVGIRAELDRNEYQPGKQAKLNLSLTDKVGTPVPGAISLAAVDEAVYFVLPQAPGMERGFCNLDKELLKPVWSICNWSPDQASDPDLEQAIFAVTAVSMGEVAFPHITANSIPAVQRSWPLSLSVSSYPTKEAAVQRTRTSGQAGVAWGCTILAVFAAVGMGVALWPHFCRAMIALGAILAGFKTGCVELVVVTMLGMVFVLGAVTLIGTNSSVTFSKSGSAIASAAAAGGGGGGYAGYDRSASRYEPPPLDPVRKSAPRTATHAQTTSIRTRQFFPETLLWVPQLVTDDQGKAELKIDLADSITTWRLSASAVTADGQLGASSQDIRVFQPFFVEVNQPLSLTRHDEAAIPIVVSNYLDKPQKVVVSLKPADWFANLEEGSKTLELQPNENRSVSYRIKALKVGRQPLEVQAIGNAQLADAVRREIEVVPEGRRLEQAFNGTLQSPAEVTLSVPESAIEGSPKAIVKLYPSTFSQVVEGLDNIFQMPNGCFEQTSSTTYPNVLALDYLRQTKKSAPEVEAKARGFIHQGYQRLLTFEVQGGGFSLYGKDPADPRLTAYGLMEFGDMARVHPVDPKVIGRARDWLLQKRNPDGSWSGGYHGMPNGPQDLATLSMTAYVAWAVFSTARVGPVYGDEKGETLRFLLSHKPEAIVDPYVLALTCNALIALDPKKQSAKPYLQRLESLKKSAVVGKETHTWWELAPNACTGFYGSGIGGSVETTSLAVLALTKAGDYPATVRGALNWITARKDPHGTWRSTQATVLALKALLAGTSAPLDETTERHFKLTLDGQVLKEIKVPASKSEVMQQVEVSAKQLAAGEHKLELVETSKTGSTYQVSFRYHLPETQWSGADKDALKVDVNYERTELAVNETVNVAARIKNQTDQIAPMLILDLPIPAGFTLVPDDLAKAVVERTIDRFEVTARGATIYHKGLEPGAKLELQCRLRATMAVKVQAEQAHAYEYYNPDRQGLSNGAQLNVLEKR